jgi:hypothetical protein
MLRMETEAGWWLITHPDHARLAGEFAAAWGNEKFQKPKPRVRVLKGIARHDDGWTTRDAHPTITREGKPSAFSVELVGKYSAFEEIDLEEYLGVRERAVSIIAKEDPYAALLISMHTYSLLTEHADRTTIAAQDLPILDRFLENQRVVQGNLRAAISADGTLTPDQKTHTAILEHFRLLQACDNLSLLSCVAFSRPADLLHPLPLNDGGTSRVEVISLAPRHFRLRPWPFAEPELTFHFPARYVEGKTFASSHALDAAFSAADTNTISVTLTQ